MNQNPRFSQVFLQLAPLSFIFNELVPELIYSSRLGKLSHIRDGFR